jgi:hypothetical protein
MNSTLITDGTAFRVETDTVDITTDVPEPDPNWGTTDSHGHEHRWLITNVEGGIWHSGELPTLRWVVDEEWIDEDNFEREEGHYECVRCGDTVEPGRKMPPPIRRTIPGMRHYFIDDRPVDEETFKAAIEQAKLDALQ